MSGEMKDHPLSIRARTAILAGFAAAFSLAALGLWLTRGELKFLFCAAFCFVEFLVLLAIFARLPSRFSLRSLLIATTLLAVVLGLAVWAGR
jgi:hypothetical protein